MFTGIVTDIGTIVTADQGRFRIACNYDSASIELGASIACNGCCLTVTRVGSDSGSRTLFDVEASNETLALTTLGNWQAGRQINLERSLKMGDELGGHMMTGHVDGVAEIISAVQDGNSVRFDIASPPMLAPFVARKGSVALDGTSLTVNSVEGNRFTVNIIPHTLEVTTWRQRRAGDRVNMEVDLIARYVARLHEASGGAIQ